jgi:rRNA maturation protein Nop10
MATEAKSPPTVSVYFRVSPRVREDAERFGVERSLTLSSALASLVERGLEAVGSEESVRVLEAKAQGVGQELAVLQERDRGWQTMFNSLQGQLQTLRVGKCPKCGKSVTAFDQLLARRCPACGEAMEQVVVEQAEEFPPALAALVGAVGGLLFGIASKGGGGLGA